MTNSGPVLTLNNGEHMPAVGLGVFQSPPEQTTAAVETAIAAGYRAIDTAAAYFNEREVGEGIRRSGIERADLWVQTKLWISDYGYDRALRAFDASLDRLDVAYVDLYLLHWPMPSHFETTIASYHAAERLLAEGRVRAIGVCNFSPTHLEQLIARSEIVPSVNQVELHPFFTQREVRATDVAHGTITQSWSPLGGVNVYAHRGAGQARNPLENPLIRRIAEKYGKTPAQVVLRWHMEHGLSAIPKSIRPERIVENFAIFDFALTVDEVAAIDGLDTGERGGPDPEKVDTALFTKSVEEHYRQESADRDRNTAKTTT